MPTGVLSFVQRLVGYLLSGSVAEAILPILYGPGRNGKTTFVLQDLLGTYAGQAPPHFLTARTFEAHPTELAALRAKRFVAVTESEADRDLDVARVTALTGGDRVTARLMRQDFVTFPPTWTFAMIANHLPRVTASSDAAWDRLCPAWPGDVLEIIPCSSNTRRGLIFGPNGDS